MSHLLPVVGPTGSHPTTSHPTGSHPDTLEEATSIITIQKARLKDQHLTCEFTEQRTEDSPPRAFALTCQEQAHPDLPHRLSRLVPHLCLLTEQLTEPKEGVSQMPNFWPDEAEELPAHLAAFTVTGLSLGRNLSGVTLIGYRQLTAGKVLNLTSPYVSFEDLADIAYPHAGRLETTVHEALTEIEEALRGKRAEVSQLDLFAPPALDRIPVLPIAPQA